MKRKELLSLRTKDIEDLSGQVSKKRLELTKIKAEMKVSKEKNLKKVKNIRRDLAQILTVINEKEMIKTEEVKEKEDKEK